MNQLKLTFIEKQGIAMVTFRQIMTINNQATCNFFYGSCQWESSGI